MNYHGFTRNEHRQITEVIATLSPQQKNSFAENQVRTIIIWKEHYFARTRYSSTSSQESVKELVN